jgi:hypothetical protein
MALAPHRFEQLYDLPGGELAFVFLVRKSAR